MDLRVSVPVDGYGNTPEEVHADVLAKGAGVLGCDQGEVRILGGELDLHLVSSAESRTEAAAGRTYWAKCRVAHQPAPKVIEVHEIGLAGKSPMLDTMTLVFGFWKAMTGKEPQVEDLETGDSSLAATVVIEDPVNGGRLACTIRHDWPDRTSKDETGQEATA